MASQRFSEAIIALERAKSLDSHLKEAIDLLEQSKSQLYGMIVRSLKPPSTPLITSINV